MNDLEKDSLGRINSGKKGKIYQKIAYEWLKEQGYHNFINKDPRPSQPFRFGGWPDFVCFPKDSLIPHFFEIKSGQHKLDPHQNKILQMLAEIGVVHILYYKDGKLIEHETW